MQNNSNIYKYTKNVCNIRIIVNIVNYYTIRGFVHIICNGGGRWLVAPDDSRHTVDAATTFEEFRNIDFVAFDIVRLKEFA